jgi:hypothetical protein
MITLCLEERRMSLTKPSPAKPKKSFVAHHSLSIATVIVLISWIVLYSFSEPSTHLGSFFGNAIADWSGVLVTVLATKCFYEKDSAESRRPPHPALAPIWEPLRDHSLTIFLVFTGIGWVVLYVHLNSEAKWGQVVGNIVSEWTQVLALVLMTKKLVEVHSKESHK